MPSGGRLAHRRLGYALVRIAVSVNWGDSDTRQCYA